jgi:hypothetical protein
MIEDLEHIQHRLNSAIWSYRLAQRRQDLSSESLLKAPLEHRQVEDCRRSSSDKSISPTHSILASPYEVCLFPSSESILPHTILTPCHFSRIQGVRRVIADPELSYRASNSKNF